MADKARWLGVMGHMDTLPGTNMVTWMAWPQVRKTMKSEYQTGGEVHFHVSSRESTGLGVLVQAWHWFQFGQPCIPIGHVQVGGCRHWTRVYPDQAASIRITDRKTMDSVRQRGSKKRR